MPFRGFRVSRSNMKSRKRYCRREQVFPENRKMRAWQYSTQWEQPILQGSTRNLYAAFSDLSNRNYRYISKHIREKININGRSELGLYGYAYTEPPRNKSPGVSTDNQLFFQMQSLPLVSQVRLRPSLGRYEVHKGANLFGCRCRGIEIVRTSEGIRSIGDRGC